MKPFLRVLGVLCLLPLCLLSMTLVQVLTTLHALRTTVLDADVFRSEFQEHVSPQDLGRWAGSIAETVVLPGSAPGSTDGTPSGLPIDEAWLADAVGSAIQGAHAYFAGASPRLPTVPFRPMLDAMEEAAVRMIVDGAKDSERRLEEMLPILRKLPDGGLADGIPTFLAFAYFLAHMPLEGMEPSPEAIRAMLAELLAPADPTSSTSFTERMVRIAVEDRLRLDEAKDGLDLDLFLANRYGSEDHVVRASRDAALDLASSGTAAGLWALLWVLLLIAALSFHRARTLLWLGIPLFLSGAGLVVGSVLNVFARTGIMAAFADAAQEGSPFPPPPFEELLLSLTDRLAASLMTIGMVVLGVGLVLAVLGIALASSEARKASPPKPPRRFHAVRLPIVLLLAFLLFWTARDFAVHVEGAAASIRDSVQEPADKDLVQVFDETLGTHFAELAAAFAPSPSASPES